MRNALRARHAIIALAIAGLMPALMAGCGGTAEAPPLVPELAPPVIGQEGVLRAGIDMGHAPFGGVDQDVQAGIDVDLAAAMAERLGLKLEVVEVTPATYAQALNDGRIDLALAAIPLADAVAADLSTAGSYLVNGPALFSKVASGSVEPTVTIQSLPGMRVGVQRESAAYWVLETSFGEDYAASFDTLRDAFDALEAGEVDVVAGDAAVGAYVLRDFADIRIVGQLAPAQPLGVAVRKDATELEAALRGVLDEIAAEGVLETITRKWLGDFPRLQVATD